jgi:cytidine deaminase
MERSQMSNNELSPDVTQTLLKAALRARKEAYAPYSNFAVGAAVMTDSGEIFTGCNIENASYGATVCAERVAAFKAISAGHKSIKAIAVVADHPQPVSPCGICRQVISEFGPEAAVLMANTNGQTKMGNMKDLLPAPFEFAILEVANRE